MAMAKPNGPQSTRSREREQLDHGPTAAAALIAAESMAYGKKAMKLHAMRAAVKFRGLICLLLLSLWLAAGMARAQTVTTQTAIQAALLERQSSQPVDAPTDPVFDFYVARNFAPAWTGSSAAEDQGAAVLFTLAHADRHGLRPQEYGEASGRWASPPADGVE